MAVASLLLRFGAILELAFLNCGMVEQNVVHSIKLTGFFCVLSVLPIVLLPAAEKITRAEHMEIPQSLPFSPELGQPDCTNEPPHAKSTA